MKSLYEKLNRLDDSLVESKRVVKKKKLTESVEDDKKKLFDAAASVKCKLDDGTIEYAMYDVDDFIENELVYCGKLLLSECPDMLFWRYVSDENFGGYCAVYESDEEFADAFYQISHDRVYDITDEVNGDYDYDDDIDEMLTEGVSKNSLIRWLKDNADQDVSKDEFNTLVNNLWNVIEKEDKERKFYKRGYKSIEEVDIPQLIDSSDNPVHDIGYRLLGWSDYDDDIDEKLTENRWNPYFTPYGYRDAAKVLNGKAPEYYYHLKEIEMDTGDGIKLARYALRKGLPVMVDKNSDPDYPKFAIKGEYHWNDYFYPYPTAHEEDLIAWDGKMFTEQSLTEEEGAREKLMNTYPDDFGHWEPYDRNPVKTKKVPPKTLDQYARDPETEVVDFDPNSTVNFKELGAKQKLLRASPDLKIEAYKPLKEDMSRNVIEFIQDNIGLIEVDDWNAVVDAAYRSLSKRELTELFNMLKLALDIDIKVTENKDGTVSVTVGKKEVTPVEKPKQKVRGPEVKKEQPKVQPQPRQPVSKPEPKVQPQPRQPVSKPEPKVTQPDKKDEVKDPELMARITAWDTLATKLKEFANNHKTGGGSYAIPLSMYITPNKNELTATTNELNYGFRTINDLDQEVKHSLGKTTYENNKFDVDLTQLESKYQQITKQRQRTWAHKDPRK